MKKWIIGILLTLIMAFFMMPVSAKADDVPTFKAVYVDSDNSLTFYYDSTSHSGTVYPLPNAAGSADAWGYDSVRESVIKVKIDSSVAGFHDLTSTAYMFANMEYANTIDGAEYLDVSHVTDMSYMFFCFGDEEHTITIPAGSFEKYYDETIPWYGPAWLLQYYGNPQNNTIEYIIVKGDTLNDIAKKFNCTVNEILALNTFITNPNRIYANTKLLIPAK